MFPQPLFDIVGKVGKHMKPKYKFVFEWLGGKVTAYKTQAEIAEMLKSPDIKLISVGDGEVYKPKRKKAK